MLATGWHVPGLLKLLSVLCGHLYACMCTCVFLLWGYILIISSVMWHDMANMWLLKKFCSLMTAIVVGGAFQLKCVIETKIVNVG